MAYEVVINTRYGQRGSQILFDLTNSEMYFRTYGNSQSSWKKVTHD